jgi:hypothetical protein
VNQQSSFVKAIRGTTCRDIWQLEYWYGGHLSSPCNVAFLCVNGGHWLRFFFDAGVFFWKMVPSVDAELADGDFSYRPVRSTDATLLIGKVVDGCLFLGDDGQPNRALTIRFVTGGTLTLTNVGDENVLSIGM